jgi:hypothetical protein
MRKNLIYVLFAFASFISSSYAAAAAAASAELITQGGGTNKIDFSKVTSADVSVSFDAYSVEGADSNVTLCGSNCIGMEWKHFAKVKIKASRVTIEEKTSISSLGTIEIIAGSVQFGAAPSVSLFSCPLTIKPALVGGDRVARLTVEAS